MQKRAIRIIFACFMYDEALVKVSLVTLSNRRRALTDKLLKKILNDKDSKYCNKMLTDYNLRKGRQFSPVFFKTNRFRNSFIVFNALKIT